MLKEKDALIIFERAIANGAEFTELFCEDRDELSISFNHAVSGIVKKHSYGAGLYLISGMRSVYVYTNDLSLSSLVAQCDRACSLLQAVIDDNRKIHPFITRELPEPNPVVIYPSAIAHSEKIKLLKNTDKAVRSSASDLQNIDLNYFDTDQRVLIANSEGIWAEDRRVSSRIRIFPTVANEFDSAGYFVDFTRPQGFEAFRDGSYADFAIEAIVEMRASLDAEEPPNGYYPIVFDAGSSSGTFFHECCGHQLESNQDLINDGIFHGKLDTRVATEKVTMVDDGTIPGAYGTSKFDDEGMPRQKNILIENGILKNYLTDRIGAKKLGVSRNACGRRQNYKFAPAARMSNTYLAAGNDDPDEMIRDISEGIFVTKLGGGQGGSDFTIIAHTAFLIKNGAIDRRLKKVTLMGRGDEMLMKIDRVGNTLLPEESGMYCGGYSGLCPVTAFGARLRVERMLISGEGSKA